ncbi:MAG: hypothetical protein ABFD49_00775 [Armatimonadota bacterium]|nr:hypothetical protein [bacterium]
MEHEMTETTDIATTSSADRLSGVLDVAVDLLEDLQKVVEGGRPKAVRVRFGNKTIAELPIALTATAALATGLAAVLLTKLAIDVVNEED